MSSLPVESPDLPVESPDLPAGAPPADGTAGLRAAFEPLLREVGGSIVEPADAAAGDVCVPWQGAVAFHVRLEPPADPAAQPAGDLTDALTNLLAEVQRELGSPLAGLPRAGKQRAVRLLEERGAFELRRSAETVADALGVTRFTVYNYLNRSRADG